MVGIAFAEEVSVAGFVVDLVGNSDGTGNLWGQASVGRCSLKQRRNTTHAPAGLPVDSTAHDQGGGG